MIRRGYGRSERTRWTAARIGETMDRHITMIRHMRNRDAIGRKESAEARRGIARVEKSVGAGEEEMSVSADSEVLAAVYKGRMRTPLSYEERVIVMVNLQSLSALFIIIFELPSRYLP